MRIVDINCISASDSEGLPHQGVMGQKVKGKYLCKKTFCHPLQAIIINTESEWVYLIW